MIGRRRYDCEPHQLQAGEYMLWADDGRWYLCPPDGVVCAVTDKIWTIIVHEDESVTVSPSIRRFVTPLHPEWHGYLERGVWRTV